MFSIFYRSFGGQTMLCCHSTRRLWLLIKRVGISPSFTTFHFIASRMSFVTPVVDVSLHFPLSTDVQALIIARHLYIYVVTYLSLWTVKSAAGGLILNKGSSNCSNCVRFKLVIGCKDRTLQCRFKVMTNHKYVITVINN